MASGIYIYENQINGKVYVGQAVDLERRFYEHSYHLVRNTDKATALQRAVNKYGFENFKNFILCICDVSELNDKEIEFISKFQSNNKKYGYNLSAGGNSGMLGYKHSAETKRKVSEGKKGWIMGEAQRKFISLLHTGKKITDETRKRMSMAQAGKNHPMYGKHHKEETIQKMKEKRGGQGSYQFGKKSKNSSSQYYGVTKLISKGHTYWVAYIKVKGHKYHLGSSVNEVDAAKRYDDFVIENGLPNPLNFPNE